MSVRLAWYQQRSRDKKRCWFYEKVTVENVSKAYRTELSCADKVLWKRGIKEVLDVEDGRLNPDKVVLVLVLKLYLPVGSPGCILAGCIQAGSLPGCWRMGLVHTLPAVRKRQGWVLAEGAEPA